MPSRARKNSGRKRQRPSTDVDRISNLPESVLSHILSFLPTKDAVATSLLSKRWKLLWTNIHNLFFDDNTKLFNWGMKEGKLKFAHFVSEVLLLLNQQTIDKFSLEIFKYSEVYDVTTWIAAAVARKVKVLEFRVTGFKESDPRTKLPCSLFTCKTLEVLKLDGVMNLNIPTLVCLPNLKTLHLTSVNFQCDESFCNLVSSCSSLQTLYIRRNVYDNVVTLTIYSPTLTNLWFHFDEEYGPFPEEHNYKLEINAPALRYLYLHDGLSRDFSVEGLCSLDRANINLYFELQQIDYDHYSKAVVKLLGGVYNVKKLYLISDAFEALSHAGVLPSFWRLTRLHVEATCCGWNSLLDLVKGLNKLKFLTYEQYGGHNDANVTCWSKPDKVPVCFLSCFERMSILRVKGLEDELAMIAYILKKAKVLRTLTIQAAYHLDVEAKFQLLQKISKFPRGSKKCEIIFS